MRPKVDETPSALTSRSEHETHPVPQVDAERPRMLLIASRNVQGAPLVESADQELAEAEERAHEVVSGYVLGAVDVLTDHDPVGDPVYDRAFGQCQLRRPPTRPEFQDGESLSVQRLAVNRADVPDRDRTTGPVVHELPADQMKPWAFAKVVLEPTVRAAFVAAHPEPALEDLVPQLLIA